LLLLRPLLTTASGLGAATAVFDSKLCGLGGPDFSPFSDLDAAVSSSGESTIFVFLLCRATLMTAMRRAVLGLLLLAT